MHLVHPPIARPTVRGTARGLVVLQVVAMTLLTLQMGLLPGLSPAVEKALFGAWVMLVGLSIAFTPQAPPRERASHLVSFGLGWPMLQVLVSWAVQTLLF